MPVLAELIRQARLAAGVSLEDLSAWSRIPLEVLRRAEDGSRQLAMGEVDQYARVFGLRVEDLLAGEAGRAPLTRLLRSDTDVALDTRKLLTAEVAGALGELERVVRDIADLERALSIPPSSPPRVDGGRHPPGRHPGEHRARHLRSQLGLGDEPVPSMSAVAEQLGVRVIWVTEEQVDKTLDGACTMTPRPAVLVNLLDAGNPYPWRARITLAHELNHLLFDLVPGSPIAVSIHAKRLPSHLEEIEQTARAFAACFLAPSEGVRKGIGDRDPTSEEAIQWIGSHFGVGRTVAINRLQVVFNLSETQRNQMALRTARPYQGDFSADRPAEPIGFRGEPLLGLVRRALLEGAIRPPRARRILGLSPADPLPFPEVGELCAPVLAPEHQVLRKVTIYLAAHHPGLTPGAPERLGDEWQVPILDGGFGPGPRNERGHLIVSARGEVRQDLVTPGAPDIE